MQIIKKNQRFPADPIMGDIVTLDITKDLFVFDGKKWILVGGQYLDPQVRAKIYAYLDDGWEYSNVMRYDLLNYLDLSKFFDKMFYNRILDLADKIMPQELDSE
jgi:hypothetical protein